MTCCCLPSGLPNITLRNIFKRIRCVSACCWGEVVILYYSPESPASFVGVDAVYRIGKNGGKFKISQNKIREWLKQQDTYTLHKPIRYRFKRNTVIVGEIDE